MPRFIAGAALALALVYLLSLAVTSPAAGDQVAFGHRFVGSVGWIASAGHAVFFLWLAYTAIRRRSVAVWGTVGYCVYLIENIWLYSVGEGRGFFASTSALLTVNALVTVVLLTFCRLVLQRRPLFDR